MNDDFIEIWVVVLKLCVTLLFIYLKDFLFDSNTRPLIFLCFLLEVYCDCIFEGGSRFECTDLFKPSDHNILQSILESPSFSLTPGINPCIFQMFWHIHDVIKRERFSLYDCSLLKLLKPSPEVLVPW